MRAVVRDAYDVISEVVLSNPAIEFVNLVSYEENSTWRERLHLGEPPAFLELLSGLKQDERNRTSLTMSRVQVVPEKLRELAAGLGERRVLGVCSLVQLSGCRSAHIPMIDFLCPPSEKNLANLSRMLPALRAGRGVLLESGRSYHFYGFCLVSAVEWQAFMGKCLLMSGLVDDRYIGHQLVDGHCVLRLSSGTLKHRIPVVVAEIP